MNRVLVIPPNDILRHPIPNRIYHIASRLSRKYEVMLLYYPKHPHAKDKLRDFPHIPVTYRGLGVKNLGIYYVVNAPSIYAALKKAVPQADTVIHANILPSLIATKLAKRYKKPAIYDYVDHYPESAAAYYKSDIAKFVVREGTFRIVYPALKDSTHIVVPSYGLRHFLKSIIDKPISVIPNGVDAEKFRPMDMAQARKAIGLDTENFTLLLQGSIDVWQEIEPVIYAVKKLNEKNIKVDIVIVGYSHGKYYYQKLMGMIKALQLQARIHTYPPQPYEKMPFFISATNALVAPFKKGLISYATPLKIIEALACGRPVLTTDITEFKIWFRKGLFIYNDIKSFMNNVKYLIQNWEDIEKILSENSAIIRKTHSWDTLANKYINILNTVI
ncbi:Glycosyltransferase [Pyrobaculum oguniense TE7]|uniref:Glycosyltransferase n=1 Tax=Pyrobaculum oguniense (strain DSM 13380 / JCM 10595 / TE7) TaxID=698757 RepID=H6QB89_PYROT|nr:Glycosyltransferase [Pyrobaculum oguniense TE7]